MLRTCAAVSSASAIAASTTSQRSAVAARSNAPGIAIRNSRKAAWRAPILAVAVGLYLPLELSTPIFAGGLLADVVDRWLVARHRGPALETARQSGLLISAGLIAGEAIMGVLIAIPIVVYKRADVMSLPQAWQFGQWPAALLITLIGVWTYFSATRTTASRH